MTQIEDLHDRLREVLGAIVEAWTSTEAEPAHRPVRVDERPQHANWPLAVASIQREEVRALRGWVSHEVGGPNRGLLVRPTPDAVAAFSDIEASPADLRWTSGLVPLLEELAQAVEGGRAVDVADLSARTARPVHVLEIQLRYLAEAEYLTAVDDPEFGLDDLRITPKGLEHGRGWPGAGSSQMVDAFLAALDASIERAPDAEERTRLQRLRDYASDVSKSVLAGAIVAGGRAAEGSL